MASSPWIFDYVGNMTRSGGAVKTPPPAVVSAKTSPKGEVSRYG